MGSVQTPSSHFHALLSLPFPHPLSSRTLGVFQAICPTQALRASESADYRTAELKLPVRHGRGRQSEPTVHHSQKILHEIHALCQERSHARFQWLLEADPGLGDQSQLPRTPRWWRSFSQGSLSQILFLPTVHHFLLSS